MFAVGCENSHQRPERTMKREKGKLTIPVTGRCEACGWISNLAWVLAKLYLIGRDGSIGQVNPTQNEHKQ